MAPNIPTTPDNKGFQEVGCYDSMTAGWKTRVGRLGELATHPAVRPPLGCSSVHAEQNREEIIRGDAQVCPWPMRHTLACNDRECSCKSNLLELHVTGSKLPETIDSNEFLKLDRLYDPSYVPPESEAIAAGANRGKVAEMADLLELQAERAKRVTIRASNSGLPRKGWFTPSWPLSRSIGHGVPEKYLIPYEKERESLEIWKSYMVKSHAAEPPNTNVTFPSTDEDMTEDEWDEAPRGGARKFLHAKG